MISVPSLAKVERWLLTLEEPEMQMQTLTGAVAEQQQQDRLRAARSGRAARAAARRALRPRFVRPLRPAA
ncbi:MAG TPA: hypothetical protein VM266_11680 [Solirubrobacteraceae bacterium]|nr:hypothetical protein [Solirubrobacteraceae bacterium]